MNNYSNARKNLFNTLLFFFEPDTFNGNESKNRCMAQRICCNTLLIPLSNIGLPQASATFLANPQGVKSTSDATEKNTFSVA